MSETITLTAFNGSDYPLQVAPQHVAAVRSAKIARRPAAALLIQGQWITVRETVDRVNAKLGRNQ